MSTIDSKNLLTQLSWRYATKQFDPSKKIASETWDALEDSLVLTPSSFGLQPWHFFVVQNEGLRQELLPHSWGQKQVVDCSHFVVLAAKISMTNDDIDRFLKRTIDIRGGVQTDLDPYRQVMAGFVEGMSNQEKIQWAKLQSYVALGQLMTSAALLGVDACPMEGLLPAKYDEVLGLAEKGLTTSVACALGYRAESDKYAKAPKVRFAKENVVSVL